MGGHMSGERLPCVAEGMNVKGTAFLARKLLLERQFGEEDAKRMLEAAVAAVADFPRGFSIGSDDVLYKIHFRRGPISAKKR
jgi:hypothetical protein